ncbi:cytochrome P450 [Gymnopus androsaceus JB14]|uniref:Cytochrome P450 n=1 Tax=Gymnopus androsaceus JB14 TaxID=1447944 RepID=A0A6A4I9Y2_9AGAR|nr:cytochrome P450 [Gymnopus androsaceus JB14]
MDFSIALYTFFLAIVLFHFIPWIIDAYGIRSYPGPLLAKLSDFWLGWVAFRGHRSEIIHELHRKLGPIVRIAPNHISIADPKAIKDIYAHRNGPLKSEFYDGFLSIVPGTFTTRSRKVHARKRKMLAQALTTESIAQFETIVQHHVCYLVDRLGALFEDTDEWFDCLAWMNYLIFDTIGDLVFGTPFGMLAAGKDTAPVAQDLNATMALYGSGITTAFTEFPAAKILEDRSAHSAHMGVLPAHWRPVARLLPWYREKNRRFQAFNRLTAMAIAKRLAGSEDRDDLLNKIRTAKDENDLPLGREELTVEAATLLLGGTHTTSTSLCAIIYSIAQNPQCQARLQRELDDTSLETADALDSLPYLNACINEGLRLYPAIGQGLPRVIPPGGLVACGVYFRAGTVVSVPSFTIHRCEAIWGDEPDLFLPERWLQGDASKLESNLLSFSIGPRSCAGRLLALMQLRITIASLFRRFNFALKHPDDQMNIKEGFVRRPEYCFVGIQHRASNSS